MLTFKYIYIPFFLMSANKNGLNWGQKSEQNKVCEMQTNKLHMGI